jgi:hypothetical protein
MIADLTWLTSPPLTIDLPTSKADNKQILRGLLQRSPTPLQPKTQSTAITTPANPLKTRCIPAENPLFTR